MSDTPTVPQVLSDAVLAKIQAASKDLPPAFRDIAVTYAPAVIRIVTSNANADLSALYKQLTGATSASTLDAIHASMTREELENEKLLLADLQKQMTQDSYEAKQVGERILKAALSAGISLALAAAGF